MFAATAAGIYPKVEEAMAAMGQGFDAEYFPDQQKVRLYAKSATSNIMQLGNFIEDQCNSKIQLIHWLRVPGPVYREPVTGNFFINESVIKYIREEAYEANMQLPALGLVLFHFW